MSEFQISILAADHVFYKGPCESLNVPTNRGLMGILAHHTNMISAVVPGKLSFKEPGKPVRYAAVSAGLVKIEDNEVLVLVDTAERPEDIDANRAKQAADAAKEAMRQKQGMMEHKMARANLAREINRLRVKSDSPMS